MMVLVNGFLLRSAPEKSGYLPWGQENESPIVSDKENWELAKDTCPGINPDGSFEDFVR